MIPLDECLQKFIENLREEVKVKLPLTFVLSVRMREKG